MCFFFFGKGGGQATAEQTKHIIRDSLPVTSGRHRKNDVPQPSFQISIPPFTRCMGHSVCSWNHFSGIDVVSKIANSSDNYI